MSQTNAKYKTDVPLEKRIAENDFRRQERRLKGQRKAWIEGGEKRVEQYSKLHKSIEDFADAIAENMKAEIDKRPAPYDYYHIKDLNDKMDKLSDEYDHS